MRFSKIAAYKAQQLLLRYSDPAPVPEPAPEESDPRPEMLCFRGQTLALVRHFFELSSQVGRLPSLLGREFFRARVSHHAIPSFEEQVVFTRDIELCLSRLNNKQAEIITLVGLYDFTHEEVAEMLHKSKAAISRWFSEALDALAELFLEAGLLLESRPDRRQRQLAASHLPAGIVGSRKKPPQSVRTLPKPGVHVGCRLELALA